MLYLGTVNLVAVLGAAIASMIIGFIWYMPLFGNQWSRLMGFSKKDMNKAKQKSMSKLYLIHFLAGFVTAYILALFVQGTAIFDALIIGFLIWIGFFAAAMVGTILWEGKPFSLYLINVTYWLVNIEVMAAILSTWA